MGGSFGPRTTGSAARPRSTRPSPWVQASSPRGTARRRSGKRPSRRRKATSASSRASGAPEAVVGAVAEGEVPAGGRVTSRRSGSSTSTGSRLAAPMATSTCWPAGTVTPSSTTGCGRDPEGGVGHGGGEPQQLLDGAGEQLRVPPKQPSSWSGWSSRATTPLPIRLLVVSWPATISWNSDDSTSASVSLAPAAASTRTADEVAVGIGPGVGDEGAERAGRRRRTRRRPPGAAVTARGAAAWRTHRAGPPVVVLDAEQLADDAERQRRGRSRRAGRRRPRARRRRASRGGRRRGAAPRAHRRHPRRPERRRHQAAEAAVVGGVHGEHVVGEVGPGQPLGHHVGIAGRARRSCPWTGVRRRGPAGGVVAEHHPGVVAVGEPGLLHRATATRLGERREGVVTDGVVPAAPTRARSSGVGAEAGAQQGDVPQVAVGAGVGVDLLLDDEVAGTEVRLSSAGAASAGGRGRRPRRRRPRSCSHRSALPNHVSKADRTASRPGDVQHPPGEQGPERARRGRACRRRRRSPGRRARR